jgi:hypothetical protein
MTEGEKWLKGLSDYEIMVATMGHYDDTIDYVGPQSNERMNKLIPRYLPGGVDINACAFRHDWAYAQGGDSQDRFHADASFLTDMLNVIELHEWTIIDLFRFLPYRAEKRAWHYYKAVRIAGKDHFNNH